MRIIIEDLSVIFPYKLVFNEQVQYMTLLKRTLDSTGHAILEMPTGTGKTICLLALLTSYLSQRTKYKKLIYCTRTVVEMEKTLKEIKSLLIKRQSQDPQSTKFVCIGLTAKKNICVHDDIDEWRKTETVETQCKKRTSESARIKNQSEQNSQCCQYYQNLRKSDQKIEKGVENKVFTMEDLRKYGKQTKKCPYFFAREALKEADIIVFNYLYLIDPKISPNFIKDLSKDTIVVFDEAHNIDDVCIEAYTLDINKNHLNSAEENLKYIKNKIKQVVDKSKQTYESELHILMNKLKDKLKGVDIQELENNKIGGIPQSILNTQVYLISFQVVIQFLRNKLKENIVRYYDNLQFRKQFEVNTNLQPNFFKLLSQKLNHTLSILRIDEVQQLRWITGLAFFCELIFTHQKGFKIIYQPTPMDGNIAQPVITLACLDCSLPMKSIWKSFPCVIITSGTMSPIELYPRLLGFEPIIVKSIDIQLGRNPISPLIISQTRGCEPLSSQYKLRSQKSVSRSYGDLLIAMSEIVPDGILCFFPSYMYLEHLVKNWMEDGQINEILKNRYLFIEKKDQNQTEKSILQFRKACDIGRGAIFLAIARGKIAEGVDFEQHYGRCVIMMGFPVQNSLDPVLLERIKYMIQMKQIRDKNEFFEFDTMRQCAQCLGRVIRRKTDYGLMILADSRFSKKSRIQKLPKWILKFLEQQNISLTFERALLVTTDFFRKMGKKYVVSSNHYMTEKQFEQQSKSQ